MEFANIKKFIEMKGFSVENTFIDKHSSGETIFIHAISKKNAIHILISINKPVRNIPLSHELVFTKLEHIDTVAAFVHIDDVKVSVSDNIQEFYDNDASYHSNAIVATDSKMIVDQSTKVVARQLRRLLMSMKTDVYGLAIISAPLNQRDSILVVGGGSNVRINTYRLKSKLIANGGQLALVSMSLKTFYDKCEVVDANSVIIMNGIHQSLSNAHKSHMMSMKTLVEQYTKTANFGMKLDDAKHKFNEYIDKYTNMLSKYDEKRLELQVQLDSLSTTTFGNLPSTMANGFTSDTIQNQISELDQLVKKISATLLSIRDKYTQVALDANNAVYHNLVMLNSVLKNLETLSEMENAIFDDKL
jgi:hypothetical protein